MKNNNEKMMKINGDEFASRAGLCRSAGDEGGVGADEPHGVCGD